MEGLGHRYDIGVGTVPQDTVAGAVTGKRVHLKNASSISFVVITTGASTDILDVDVQQHTAGTSGTTADLDVVTRFYYKSATTLDNSQQWTKGTQAAASEITNVGAASEQLLLVIEVEATSLSDGYEWVSIDFPDQGTNATKYTACVYILHGLNVQRAPAQLAALLT